MSKRQLMSDQVLKITATLFLALLAWQGKSILARIEALEKNQTAILIHLGVPPVAQNSLEIGEKKPLYAVSGTMPEFKLPPGREKTLWKNP